MKLVSLWSRFELASPTKYQEEKLVDGVLICAVSCLISPWRGENSLARCFFLSEDYVDLLHIFRPT